MFITKIIHNNSNRSNHNDTIVNMYNVILVIKMLIVIYITSNGYISYIFDSSHPLSTSLPHSLS